MRQESLFERGARVSPVKNPRELSTYSLLRTLFIHGPLPRYHGLRQFAA